MEVTYQGVGTLVEAFDEEQYQTLHDEDNGENNEDRR